MKRKPKLRRNPEHVEEKYNTNAISKKTSKGRNQTIFSNTWLKRCVLRFFLNCVKETDDFTSAGNLFHRRGAACEKDRSPHE